MSSPSDSKENTKENQKQVPSIPKFVGKIYSFIQGAHALTALSYGEELGLFEGLSKLGPCDSKTLAHSLALNERWVREWLALCAANGIVDYCGDEVFEMNETQKATLTNEAESPAYLAGWGAAIKAFGSVVKKIPDCFRTGTGLTYDEMGPDMTRMVESSTKSFLRHTLVKVFKDIPGVNEIISKDGVRIADFGCGTGEASRAVAKAFPKADVHAYDISSNALEKAREITEKEGITNLTFHNAGKGDPLPGNASFDIVFNNDVIHDLPFPQGIITSIFEATKKGGVFISIEPNALDSMDENLRNNPFAPVMYGFSVNVCLNHGMSGGPTGEGLGTCGLSEKQMKSYCEEAGFSSLLKLSGAKYGDPSQAIFVVKKD